ncbi:proprotein convertase subtilisin/kexin type 5-like [Saccostrea echinata]|uniref:proprotein convertase subtilisin/kexin type 5-like n=1 Tax=Saccostrea echinata TaxID=191078 RepID=UPI002A808F88|nr:proprotein convertase subtilisin/kexin type 5-like [Saccostrea echinata]
MNSLISEGTSTTTIPTTVYVPTTVTDKHKVTTSKPVVTSKAECPVGQFLNGSICSLCQKHFYQDMAGQHYCLPCPLGKKTSGVGSSSSSQCFDDCREGTELKPDGECVECPHGYYRSFSEDVCTPCAPGMTTAGNDTTGASGCEIKICYNGTFRNSSNVCVPCPVGEYQPMNLQEKCMKCPINCTTESDGKNNKTDCIFYCPAGYEVLAAANETCRSCPRGQYKNNTNVFSKCSACPSGNTTESMKTTSINDCSINICSSGQEIGSSGGCVDCEIDYYQSVDVPTSKDKCKTCPSSTGTKQKMSNSSSDCLPVCSRGQFYNSTSSACQACPKGTWNNGNFTMKFEGCTVCRVNYTTTGPGMISEDNCTLLFCDMGFYFHHNSCIPCSIGYYKAYRGNMSCTKCPDGFLTTNEASVSPNDCSDPYCIPGKYVNSTGQCDDCMIGYYKSATGNDNCTACSRNSTTPSRGSTLPSDCSIVVCEAGEKRISSNNTCMKCPVAYYQPNRGQSVCLQCSAKQTTEQEGTVYQADCVPICQPGEEFNSTVKTCGKCALGYYKSAVGNSEPCTKCPDGKTTLTTGSISSAACNIMKCATGSYHDTNMGTCKNCSRNFYQDQDGEISCKACPGSVKKFTLSEGSNSQSQCVSECSTNPNYCKNGGTCKSNDVTIWCTCKERYTGPRCGEQFELTSNTPYIIGGAVGGSAAIMVIALIICLIRCLQRSKESKYPSKEPMEYAYDDNASLFDNGSNRGLISSYARMNPSFNYDEDSFYDTRNRMYPQEDNTSVY